MSGSIRPLVRASRAVGVVAAGLVIALLSGCGASAPGSSTSVPPPLFAPTSSTASTAGPVVSAPISPASPETSRRPSSRTPAPPVVTAWGVHSRLLSVVIRNDDPREVLWSKVRITALDRRGRTIESTTGPSGSKCCSVLGLPSEREFGLFLTLPEDAPPVARVEVRYAGPHALTPSDPPTSVVDVSIPHLTRTGDDAVVTARLTAHHPTGPTVAAQAVLVDRRHRLVGVISGRFYCFADGVTKVVQMHLLHPVPPHTHLRMVMAYDIPGHAPVRTPAACSRPSVHER